MSSKSISRPYWLSVIVIGLGLVCLWGGLSLPAASRYAGIGPGAVPTFIGAVLVVLGLLLAIQIYRGEPFEAQGTENADPNLPMNLRAFLLALVAAGLPILTLKSFGLPLAAMVSFALVARSFGSTRLGWDLLTGLILGLLSWFLFDRLGLQLGGLLPLAGI
ncbi:tripartite tricarboxylate transporter TctB family protein [Paracoccus caeni]|uniref:Tripartite tricarboxylate transporter TctB family protein n=1 Tax=Paracoccus caeni TaxID=657651 RepID=A0A934VVU3_9RHOB|nr:tripartite tricarboxylate transporter TctB family protein [Paracoccus caeni]MBK4217321.1 tripartite tricarboxylate transporter TctB family protein [Paracoccus caeni]